MMDSIQLFIHMVGSISTLYPCHLLEFHAMSCYCLCPVYFPSLSEYRATRSSFTEIHLEVLGLNE
jgi:Zn-finger protein